MPFQEPVLSLGQLLAKIYGASPRRGNTKATWKNINSLENYYIRSTSHYFWLNLRSNLKKWRFLQPS